MPTPTYRTSNLYITQDPNVMISGLLPKTGHLSAQQERVIGRGMTNPFAFNIQTQGVDTVRQSHGREKISCSLRDILNTLCYDRNSDSGGERFKNPEYGCGLKRLIHEPVDPETGVWETEARGLIEIGIRKWEKRIELTAIDFVYEYLNQHLVYIPIHYIELATAQPGSYVHPFVLGSYPIP